MYNSSIYIYIFNCVHSFIQVYDAKRLIGRHFKEKQVQEDIPHFPFKVVDKDGKPHVDIMRGDKQLVMSPEEVSSMVLEKLKATAEAFLGEEVIDAVVTVPAYVAQCRAAALSFLFESSMEEVASSLKCWRAKPCHPHACTFLLPLKVFI